MTLVQVVTVRQLTAALHLSLFIDALRSHTEAEKCIVISGSANPGPSDIKVWTYIPVRMTRTTYHVVTHNFR